MTKLRLTLSDGYDSVSFIIEPVEGLPEIRLERAPVSSRDRSIVIDLTDVSTISVEECP